jgi:peptidoglycan-associated lipoprotein
MRARHVLFAAFAALLVTACAGSGKRVKPTTEIIDAPAAKAEEPAPAPAPAAEPEPEGPALAACSLLRVSFAFDSAQLDPAATEALRESARCLVDRKATRLLVEGHADERGTAAYNVALGARRAEAVKRYLADLGVTARIETVSFGEELPAAAGADESAWRENRRAELRANGDRRSDGTVHAAF